MRLNCLSFIGLMLTAWVGIAQTEDSTNVVIDSVAVDNTEINSANWSSNLDSIHGLAAIYGVQNSQRIRAKWNALQQGDRQKLRWVHIGDSHIQADLLTAEVRTKLQSHSGNGGRGWVFAHRLASTNGASDYRMQSTNKWNNYRNIKEPADHPVGLAGIALFSSESTVSIQLELKQAEYAFTSARFIIPTAYGQWGEVTGKTAKSAVALHPTTHRIKSGESLSTIARKYGTTVAALKRLNNLKTTAIRAGKTLKVGHQQVASATYQVEVTPLNSGVKTWDSPQQNWEFGGIAQEKGLAFSGLWLENDLAGHVYSAIGVNGAKFSDYLKYPAFFTELAQTQADVLVLSFGTNESYDHQSWEQFSGYLKEFIAHARAVLPDLDIVVTTPAPSYLRKNPINSYVVSYANGLIEQADALGIVVIDMFNYLGGANSAPKLIQQQILSKDRVHYTHKGYQLQGEALSQALIALLQQ